MSPQLKSFENISDHNDNPELEDEFLELPVRFRKLGELKSDENDDRVEEQTSKIIITKREMHEQNLRHAEELKRHAEELENLYSLIAKTTRRHNEEIDFMERSFRDDSQKREEILEQALSYAERLEASSLTSPDQQNQENDRLLLELRRRDAKIEKLEGENDQKDKEILKLEQQISLNSNGS